MTKPGPKPLTLPEWVARVHQFPGITLAEAQNRWRGFGQVGPVLLQHPEIETTTNRLGGVRLWPAGRSGSKGPVSRQAQRKKRLTAG